jgi:plastocyanin
MAADPVCLKETKAAPVYKEDVVVNTNKTLANVFVYVKEGVKPGSAPAPTEAVTFDQRTCHYVPHVFGIRVNQTLKIVNSDPTLHNVHALPKSSAPFNSGMPTQGQSIEKKFGKPEQMVKIKCDVHGWMHAYAGVMDHPYFAVTDANGNFTIKDLPPGEYTLEAWHEKLGTKTAKLSVAATDSAKSVDFNF